MNHKKKKPIIFRHCFFLFQFSAMVMINAILTFGSVMFILPAFHSLQLILFMPRSSILRSLNSCSKKQNMIKQPQAAHVVISMFSIPSFWRKKSMQIIGLLIERKRTQRSHRGVYLFWGHLDIKIANNLKVMEEAWHFDFFGSAEAKLTQTPTKFKLFRTVASLLNKISV